MTAPTPALVDILDTLAGELLAELDQAADPRVALRQMIETVRRVDLIATAEASYHLAVATMAVERLSKRMNDVGRLIKLVDPAFHDAVAPAVTEARVAAKLRLDMLIARGMTDEELEKNMAIHRVACNEPDCTAEASIRAMMEERRRGPAPPP